VTSTPGVIVWSRPDVSNLLVRLHKSTCSVTCSCSVLCPHAFLFPRCLKVFCRVSKNTVLWCFGSSFASDSLPVLIPPLCAVTTSQHIQQLQPKSLPPVTARALCAGARDVARAGALGDIAFHKGQTEISRPHAVAVAAGAAHSCCLTRSGVLLAWRSWDANLAVQEVCASLAGKRIVSIAAGLLCTHHFAVCVSVCLSVCVFVCLQMCYKVQSFVSSASHTPAVALRLPLCCACVCLCLCVCRCALHERQSCVFSDSHSPACVARMNRLVDSLQGMYQIV
jgi:hypothetical protein